MTMPTARLTARRPITRFTPLSTRDVINPPTGSVRPEANARQRDAPSGANVF